MPRSKAAPWQRSARVWFALFLLLPVALFAVFYIYPVIDTIRLSFQSWNGLSPTRTDVGLSNYQWLLGENRFYNSLMNNIRWLVFYVIGPTGLGLLLALLVNRMNRGQGFMKLVYFLPYTLPPVAVAAIWRWMYEPSAGFVNRTLEAVGLGVLAQNWIGDADTVTYSLMAAGLWWSVGFSFIVFFAGLQNLPRECLEAATIDGASPWQRFWKVTFPLLWPSTTIALGMSAVDAMRLFDLVWAMTAGGPAYSSDVLATQMYDTAFGRLQMGQASAISVAMLVVSAAVILPFVIYMARQVERAENDH
ncbi:carbohydrate ABC transporter permease [Psychromarinibacter halotolerans]|uniref:Carbohydrate ABC transporter permease n=1 Tax=Psychromarinibacter halotolerans TaxID=1775175 RepID=A0ABV7GUP1_9RHOB|nr:sugar ABC transporter permease [Psychromarinibacter halotolerans]MAQ83631.1 sugar ABC transporter permease [Maritimibacter sp.]MDF0594801.1 sugar ABC transporter permease [Psychromarinibacter halotolerans]